MTYEAMVSSAPIVLVEFYATWCPHCRRMAPVVEKLKKELKGQVEVIQLDIDQNQEVSDDNDIEGTPTFLLYRNGTLVWRQSGEMTEDELLEAIEEN